MVVGLAADGDVSPARPRPRATARSWSSSAPRATASSRLVAETCDQLVSIPMAGQLESLNAGVAASRRPLRRSPQAARLDRAASRDAPARSSAAVRASSCCGAGCGSGRRRLSIFLNSSRDDRAGQPRRGGAARPSRLRRAAHRAGAARRAQSHRQPDRRRHHPRQDRRRPRSTSWSSATPSSPASPRARSPRSARRSATWPLDARSRGAARRAGPARGLVAGRPSAGAASWSSTPATLRLLEVALVLALAAVAGGGSRGSDDEPRRRSEARSWHAAGATFLGPDVPLPEEVADLEVRGDVDHRARRGG